MDDEEAADRSANKRSADVGLFFSQEVVVRLRQKLNADKTAKQSVEEDLTADANRVKLKTRELQEQLSRAQTAARKQLTDLTVQSANSAKKLRAVIGQVRRVPPALRPLAPELFSLFLSPCDHAGREGSARGRHV